MAKSAVEEEPSADADRNTIQMNSISEFCRALGEIPTYGMAGNRQYGEEDLLVSRSRYERNRKSYPCVWFSRYFI